jgi:hypothetical protein
MPTKPRYLAVRHKETGYFYVQRVDVAEPYLIRAATGEPFRFTNATFAKRYANKLMGVTK